MKNITADSDGVTDEAELKRQKNRKKKAAQKKKKAAATAAAEAAGAAGGLGDRIAEAAAGSSVAARG